MELFTGLRDRDYAREGLFALEGRLVIEKALSHGIVLRSLLCMPSDEAAWREKAGGSFSVASLPKAEMEALVGFPFHRGALAVAERPLPQYVAPSSGCGLILWNVTDPENLGALIRSAAALGAAFVCLDPTSADPLGRKALRSSMGCALSLPRVLLPDVAALESLKRPDRPLVAAALVEAALPPASLAQRGDLVLMLGNEGFGLPQPLVDISDERVIIPMAAGIDSLNVAAAGAILMWELFAKGRQ